MTDDSQKAMPNAPINLSDPTAEYNYEEERYRQNDPPLDAYRIYNAYIPNKIFSAEIVRECLDRMISDYALDLTGIDLQGAVGALTRGLRWKNSWRWLVLEGANGFLQLGTSPDTVNHPDDRRGYASIYFWYLPKRGKIYEYNEFEELLLNSCRWPYKWSNGTLLVLKHEFTDNPAPKQNNAGTVVYSPENMYRFAVVIGPQFVKDKPIIPIAPAASFPLEDSRLISVEELRRLFRILADYYAASALKTAGGSAESSNAGADRA